MKEEKEEVKLVPCSKCSAPVLPNLAECMFCGQKDPGKLAASSMGEQFVNMRHSLRAKLRSDRKKRPAFEFATPIEKLRYHLVSDDRSYIYVIMASSVLLFMLALAIGSQGLVRLGISGETPIAAGRIWTLFSAQFLQANFMHLLFNMIWLYTLGPVVMRIFGRSEFFLIYMIGGIVGVVASTVAGNPMTVGSSAAIFGLIGSLAYASYREGNAPSALMPQFFIYTIIMLMMGTLYATVDNIAHIGGFLGGIVATLMIMDYPSNRFADWVYDNVAIAALVLSALAIVFSILVPF